MVDYDAIRAEYVTGNESLRVIAERHGISRQALEKHAQRHKWGPAKEKISEEVAKATDASLTAKKISELQAFNESDLQIAKALRSQIAKRIAQAQASERPLSANDIRTLAMAAEMTQRVGRIALGASIIEAADFERTAENDAERQDVFLVADEPMPAKPVL